LPISRTSDSTLSRWSFENNGDLRHIGDGFVGRRDENREPDCGLGNRLRMCYIEQTKKRETQTKYERKDEKRCRIILGQTFCKV
jgi:hypothetical protein